MKVSVITLHRVRNYGSSLQTLATQSLLESYGADVEIIDYYPERYTSLGLLKRLKHKSSRLEKNIILLTGARVIMCVSYAKKKIVFDKFLKKYIKTSEETYRNAEEIKNYPLQSNAYCTGSDQVWNSHWNEGIDTPFYLDFVPESEYKFSFASSIGSDSLNDDEKNAVRNMLSEYRHISVRESQGVKILQEIGINSTHVLDPTLCFNMDFWKNYASDIYSGKEYVLTYNLHHDKRIDTLAKKTAEKLGCKVFNISYNIHDIVRSGRLKWCPSVEDYLGLIKNARCVITDSFHATAFSLIFHTDFFVLYPEEASSRLRSILKLTCLENRGSEDFPELDTVLKKINFNDVENILDKQRIESKKYIEKIMAELNSFSVR